MIFEARDLPPLQAYHLITQLVAPRPIALVSTLSPEGRPNLAPFSYFMAAGHDPPSVAISPNLRRGEAKDTLRNIEATGEYVIHLVSHPMRESMNLASSEVAYGVNEWELTDFVSEPSLMVKPTRIQGAPAALECRLFQVVPHGSARYILGEVVCFHVRDDLLEGDQVQAPRLDLVARMGGDWYCRALPQDMFELPRPPRPPR